MLEILEFYYLYNHPTRSTSSPVLLFDVFSTHTVDSQKTLLFFCLFNQQQKKAKNTRWQNRTRNSFFVVHIHASWWGQHKSSCCKTAFNNTATTKLKKKGVNLSRHSLFVIHLLLSTVTGSLISPPRKLLRACVRIFLTQSLGNWGGVYICSLASYCARIVSFFLGEPISPFSPHLHFLLLLAPLIPSLSFLAEALGATVLSFFTLLRNPPREHRWQ